MSTEAPFIALLFPTVPTGASIVLRIGAFRTGCQAQCNSAWLCSRSSCRRQLVAATGPLLRLLLRCHLRAKSLSFVCGKREKMVSHCVKCRGYSAGSAACSGQAARKSSRHQSLRTQTTAPPCTWASFLLLQPSRKARSAGSRSTACRMTSHWLPCCSHSWRMLLLSNLVVLRSRQQTGREAER